MLKRAMLMLMMVAACGEEDGIDHSCAGDRKFIEAHSSCKVDSDCTIVGSCSGEWSFTALSTSAAAEASQRSRTTECISYDGPLFGNPTCKENRCTMQRLEGRYCGMPIDSGLHPAIDSGNDASEAGDAGDAARR